MSNYLSKNLEYLLRITRMSQTEMARNLNVSQQAVNGWINKGGKETMNLEILINISTMFDRSVDSLLKIDLEEYDKTPKPSTLPIDNLIQSFEKFVDDIKKLKPE